MDKNEPIDDGTEPEDNPGRGSFDKDASSDSQAAPPPPPPPPPAAKAAGDQADDAEIEPVAVDGAADPSTVIEPPTFTSGENAESDGIDATEPEPLIATSDAAATEATAATSSASGDTRLIDLGEAIADENSRAKPAPWKYALALGLPIIAAIGLIALLAGRGTDEPDFTVGDSTELATDNADAPDPDESSGSGDEAADVDPEAESATKILADAEAGSDDESDGDADDKGESANDTSANDTSTSDTATNDTPATDTTADDEPNLAPTEAPEPTVEPDPTEAPESTTEPEPTASADADDDGDNPFAVGQGSRLGDDADDEATPVATAVPTTSASGGTTSDPEPTATPTTAPTSTPTPDATSGGGTSGGGTETGGPSAGDLRTFLNLDPFTELYAGLAEDGPIYDAYKRITADSGVVTMWVPTAFTFVNSAPDGNGNELGAHTTVGESLDESGVVLRLFADGNLDEILAENGPAFVVDCTVLTNGYELPTSLDYEGLLFADELRGDDGIDGAYIIYESCLFGPEPTAIIEVALQNDDDEVVFVQMKVATSADLEALDTILRSLDF